ncbi:MAG: hypothetical protein AAGL90_17450 [Pseudomonadota bacterium]
MRIIAAILAICLLSPTVSAQQAQIVQHFAVSPDTTTITFTAPSTGLLSVEFEEVPSERYQPDVNLTSGAGLEVDYDVIRIDAPGLIELDVQWPSQWTSSGVTGTFFFEPFETIGEPDDRKELARDIEPNSYFLISLITRGDKDFVRVDVQEPSVLMVDVEQSEWVSMIATGGDAWPDRGGRIIAGEPYFVSAPVTLQISHRAGEVVIAETAAHVQVLPIYSPETALSPGETRAIRTQSVSDTLSISFEAPERGIYRLAVIAPPGTPVQAWMEGQPELIAEPNKPSSVLLEEGTHGIQTALDPGSYGDPFVQIKVDLWDKDAAEDLNPAGVQFLQQDVAADLYLHRGGDTDIVSFEPPGAGYVSFIVVGSSETIDRIDRRGVLRQSNTNDMLRAAVIDEDGSELDVEWAPWGVGGRRYGPVATDGEPINLAIWAFEPDNGYQLTVTPTFRPLNGSGAISLIGFGLDDATTDAMASASKAAGISFFDAETEEDLIEVLDQTVDAAPQSPRTGFSWAWIVLILVLAIAGWLVLRRQRAS